MQQVNRADPAPSRLKYRLHRMMLTPLYRLMLRVGIPFAVAFGAGALWFSDEDRRDSFVGALADVRDAVEQRPEFMVKLMAIDGASEGVADAIRQVLPLDFPISSFDLDLDAMRTTVVALDAVKSARLKVRQGGVLQIDVTERVPVALWRTDEGLFVLDREGVAIGMATSRVDFPDLPVIAGEAADAAVVEALDVIAALGPLQARFRGLVRMGERRWDVVLDRGQRVQLPSKGSVAALERAIAMDQAVDLMGRELTTVDLRLAERPTLRMSEYAVQELWKIKAIEAGVKN